jgi:hypothetical protein
MQTEVEFLNRANDITLAGCTHRKDLQSLQSLTWQVLIAGDRGQIIRTTVPKARKGVTDSHRDDERAGAADAQLDYRLCKPVVHVIYSQANQLFTRVVDDL